MCLGVPGRLVERCVVDDSTLVTGLVEFEGLRRRVCLELVPEASVGDYVVVHAGVAISHLDEKEAERLLRHLRLLNEIEIPEEAAP